MLKIATFLSIIFFTLSCSSNSVNLTKNSLKSRCSLEPKTGKCRASFKRYYFNQDTKRCQQFIWGGCDGVVPFKSLNRCKQMCEK